MNARLLVLAPIFAAPVLLLAACGSDSEQAESDERTASGEVLEGTISDAMLPLDTLTSAPPLLRPEPKPDADAGEEGAEDAGEPGDAPLIAEEPAPAAGAAD